MSTPGAVPHLWFSPGFLVLRVPIWAADCNSFGVPFTHRRLSLEMPSRSRRHSESRAHHHEEQRPSGRHGGPCAIPFPDALERHPRYGIVVSWTSDSFLVPVGYEQAANRVKRALSRHGLEILRECDVGARVPRQAAEDKQNCGLMYIVEPRSFAMSVAAHPSAALWLPVPLVLSDEGPQQSRVFLPVEAIVRDRAALIGLLASVQSLYARLRTALLTVATAEQSN